MSVVVVVVVLFDLTLSTSFPFLDATRHVVVFVVVVVAVFVVVAVTRKNTPYRGVTVRWGRPLTAVPRIVSVVVVVVVLVRLDASRRSFPFLDATRRVVVLVVVVFVVVVANTQTRHTVVLPSVGAVP